MENRWSLPKTSAINKKNISNNKPEKATPPLDYRKQLQRPQVY
jgi:hypothetical protein